DLIGLEPDRLRAVPGRVTDDEHGSTLPDPARDENAHGDRPRGSAKKNLTARAPASSSSPMRPTIPLLVSLAAVLLAGPADATFPYPAPAPGTPPQDYSPSSFLPT